jgi:hypothetical protein
LAVGEEALHSSRAECGGPPPPAGLNRRAGLPLGAAALAGWAASLLVFWPGIALYDSVEQYRQAIAGDYDDWHPPIMARLWSLFVDLWPGGAPMLLLQTGLYWTGLGLIAVACARAGRRLTSWSILAIGSFFLLSCWLGAVLKDSQMVGALMAASGIAALSGPAERPSWTKGAILLLLGYAVLLRANAVFAVVPLGFVLLGIARRRPAWLRALLGSGTIAALILIMPPINHRLLGAEASGVEKSLLVYDLAGTELRGRFGPCYSRVEWDRSGEPGCPGHDQLQQPDGTVLRAWAAAILDHPLAYAAHRLVHFDTTMRVVVPSNLPHAVGPVDPEPNRLGLGGMPNEAARALHRLGPALAELPLSWPGFWLALDLVAVWAAAESPDDDAIGTAASALSLSALLLGASFLMVSVASDLRYHLWTMIAAALSLALLAGAGRLRRGHLLTLAGAALAVTAAGLLGRLVMPPMA